MMPPKSLSVHRNTRIGEITPHVPLKLGDDGPFKLPDTIALGKIDQREGK
jgi:hypothetical protein